MRHAVQNHSGSRPAVNRDHGSQPTVNWNRDRPITKLDPRRQNDKMAPLLHKIAVEGNVLPKITAEADLL